MGRGLDICLSSGGVSTWAERAGFRHSIDGGTEEGSAAVLVFPLTLTSSPLLSAVGWRAVFDSDPISIMSSLTLTLAAEYTSESQMGAENVA